MKYVKGEVPKDLPKEAMADVMRAIVERINSSMNDLLNGKAEKKKAEETKPSQRPLKEFTVMDNGVTAAPKVLDTKLRVLVALSRSCFVSVLSRLFLIAYTVSSMSCTR